MQSSKNVLQEYCQKHGYPLPKYTTHRITDTPDHIPLFQSTVQVEGMTEGVEGNQEPTKKKAEMSAAAKLYEFIEAVSEKH